MIEARFEKYDLVICDEFGYISYNKKAAEIRFTYLSLRTGNKATIITTNLAFDRLTHKAIFINMIGQSYKTKETKKLNQNLKIKEWFCIFNLRTFGLKGGTLFE